MKKRPPMFAKGDRAIFLGSSDSCYGENPRSAKYIGEVVTIKDIYPGAHPYAYLFQEFGETFWFSEDCFDPMVLPELPEFVAAQSLDMLI